MQLASSHDDVIRAPIELNLLFLSFQDVCDFYASTFLFAMSYLNWNKNPNGIK